jgi:hypothetical protein
MVERVAAGDGLNGGMVRSWCVSLRLALAMTFVSVSVLAQPAAQAQPQGAPHHHPAAEAMTLFPARDASGTAWLPMETPMYGVQRMLSGWSVMLHGTVYGQFLYESGTEHHGGRQAGSINWAMAHARRTVGSGRLGLRLMASVEPWTLSGCGYPNLLATGEVCDEDSIHDRQHQHDLFMELAADYERPLTPSLRWQVYAGLAGEPALGPPAFPHRVSAMANPIAPIAHHWLDSTHIAFGLVTTGVATDRWKAEVSLFNGREPDDERWDFDLAALDSIAGRLSVSPTDRLTLQVSTAHLEEAEAEFPPTPRTDVHRTTASATYHRPLGTDRLLATTLAWGLNAGIGVIPGGTIDERTHAVMLESSLALGERHAAFARVEVVEKPAHDLHAHEYSRRIFTVGKLQGGYVRYLAPWKGLVPGLGATVSASLLPPELAPRYDGRIAPGLGVFAILRPARHVMQ